MRAGLFPCAFSGRIEPKSIDTSMWHVGMIDHMERVSIRIHNAPRDLVVSAKHDALSNGLTFSGWVLEAMRSRLEAQHDDVRGAGSSEAGKTQRGRHRATMPDVPAPTSEAERLHPVQPMRTQLDERGAGDRSAPASHATHSTYNAGKDGRWCSDCKLYF